MNQDSNGHRPLAPALPASEAAFVAALNRELAHRAAPLRASDTIRDVLDSLEIVVVWAWLDDLGAELPPGIERTVVTVSDLYEHAGFRWEAEGRVP